MSDKFVGPGEPAPMASGMRAKDLVNIPCLIRPNSVEEGMGTDDLGNPKAYTYVDCDVWTLDSNGITDHGTHVQISWVRTIDNLTNRLGQFVAAKPIKDGASTILQEFTEKGNEIARKAIAQLEAEGVIPADTAPSAAAIEEYSDGEEPF